MLMKDQRPETFSKFSSAQFIAIRRLQFTFFHSVRWLASSASSDSFSAIQLLRIGCMQLSSSASVSPAPHTRVISRSQTLEITRFLTQGAVAYFCRSGLTPPCIISQPVMSALSTLEKNVAVLEEDSCLDL